MKLTAARRRVLELAALFPDVACSNITDETIPCVSTTVAQALADADLVRLVDWNGRTYACRITDAGRVEAIADLHQRQAAIAMSQRDPRTAAAADNARLGVLEALDVLDAMTTGRELAPLPQVATDTPSLFDPQEVGTAP